MFEINLLNKTKPQNNAKKKPIKEIIENKDLDLTPKNDNRVNYILNSIVFLILSFFIYTIYNNSNNIEYFDNISPGDILSLIYSAEKPVIDVETDKSKFIIVKDISSSINVNKEQSYYDSLLSIKSYVSVNENSKNIYFIYNWHNYKDENWSIEKLYNELRASDILTSKIELFRNKIIMVSEYDEMINLFNILKSLNMLNNFNYNIELLKNKMSNISYYKILISSND